MRPYCTARGTLLSALWWPKWEGNPEKRRYTFMYNWFTLQYSRHEQSVVNYTPVKLIVIKNLFLYRDHCPYFLKSSKNIASVFCILGFSGDSAVQNLPTNAGDVGLIPGSGRSPGEGNGNPLQYSCLENPMDRGAWWAILHGVRESQTQLSD